MRLQSNVDTVKRELRAFFDRSEKAAKEILGETAAQITEDMREPGKPVEYPVQWDSEKQRRAFFATDGFGKGIPYTRTGAYANGWKKEELPNGFSVSNQHPAGAIGGTLSGAPSLLAQGGTSLRTWQSKIHRGRWKLFLVTAAQRISELPRTIIQKLRVKVKGNG